MLIEFTGDLRKAPGLNDFRIVLDDVKPVEDEEILPGYGRVLVPYRRFLELALQGAWPDQVTLGVRMAPEEAVEDLVPFLSHIGFVWLVFPKFRDGRAYSTAAILRQRYHFSGEIRAVGEVFLDQAWNMLRCGINKYETSAALQDFVTAAGRYRHVYQRSSDLREPAFQERRRL